MSTISELNDKTDAALADRTGALARVASGKATNGTPASPAPKRPARPARKAPPAPAPAPAPATKKGLSPKERAARPVTATVAAYAEWLNAEIYGGKLTAKELAIAGVSLTLYGGYQARKNGRA